MAFTICVNQLCFLQCLCQSDGNTTDSAINEGCSAFKLYIAMVLAVLPKIIFSKKNSKIQEV